MGFFSWRTQDMNRSIASSYSINDTEIVYLCDDKGNYWKESNYEGYGVFNGKDFYELLAEMNGGKDRNFGINLFFNKEGKKFKSPNLVNNLDSWKYIEDAPKDCEFQGYFY